MTAARALAAPALLVAACAVPLRAQAPDLPLHGTVFGWSERTWLSVLDRGAVDGGRLTDQGWLLRFHSAIDDEYAIDVISVSSPLSDEYSWQYRRNGMRYRGGSINHRDLIGALDAKADVGLGRGWTARFRFDKEDRPGLARNLPRLGIEKAWSGPFAFAETTVDALKPEMDVTLGGGWRDGHGEAALSLTMLDAFSDVIYQGLVVYEGFADTAIDYERRPLALRAKVHRQLGRHLRVEADLGAALPSTLRAYRQAAPDSGFRQDEQFGMAAGLVEWTTLPAVRVGAFTTWVRTIMDRAPLPEGRPEDDFRLEERTTQVGGYAQWRPSRGWQVESWLLREHRPETRTYGRPGANPDVDYEDKAWRGQTMVRRLWSIGLEAGAAFELDLRDVVRGAGEVPSVEGDVGRRNTRLRLELGWRFDTRFWIEAGYRIDLDGDAGTDHGSFDGAHTRIALFW